MCHVVLALPFLSLPVFWLWPAQVALPVYGTILALSLWMYFYILRLMKRPVTTGSEEILRSTGKVIHGGKGKVLVRVHSETWNAVSSDRLSRGDRVQVIGVDGLILRVEKLHDVKNR
jgi:membrane-bound serine protease (ClpP class)